MSQTLSLRRLQELVDEWIRLHGVRYFDPLTNMAILTEEVGEVARVMARLYGEQSSRDGYEYKKEDLADELGDLIWVIACIANQTGIDLSKALEENLRKKTLRDSSRHHNNPKLKEFS